MWAHKWLVVGWLLWLIGALQGLPAAADDQEFRVDTEVFFGTEKDPKVETLTIFSEGMVYDFLLAEPREITVFDFGRGRFTLLDESRQIRAVVNAQDLMDFTRELESQAVQRKDSLLAFAARPQFETTAEEVQENGQRLTRIKLMGKPLEYVALAQASQSQQAARMYRNFADWSARLNATRPGNLPPGARLSLNQALDDRGLLPLEITRTITQMNPLHKKLEIKSRHLVNWTLSGKDRKEIERVGDFMAAFGAVSYDEYRSLPAKATATKQAQR
jgi:hypothetical protein